MSKINPCRKIVSVYETLAKLRKKTLVILWKEDVPGFVLSDTGATVVWTLSAQLCQWVVIQAVVKAVEGWRVHWNCCNYTEFTFVSRCRVLFHTLPASDCWDPDKGPLFTPKSVRYELFRVDLSTWPVCWYRPTRWHYVISVRSDSTIWEMRHMIVIIYR